MEVAGFRKGCYITAYGDLSLTADNNEDKLAYLHPERVNVITDPNIETLLTLDIIHNFT